MKFHRTPDGFAIMAFGAKLFVSWLDDHFLWVHRELSVDGGKILKVDEYGCYEFRLHRFYVRFDSPQKS